MTVLLVVHASSFYLSWTDSHGNQRLRPTDLAAGEENRRQAERMRATLEGCLEAGRLIAANRADGRGVFQRIADARV